MKYTQFKKLCEDQEEAQKFVDKIKDKQEKKPVKDLTALDDEQLEQLTTILETMSDSVTAWESDYYKEQTPILKYMPRYKAARKAFDSVVEQIRFMPSTKLISAEIVEEIKKAEEQGQLEYEKIASKPAGAI